MSRKPILIALAFWILAAISCSIGGGGPPSVEKAVLATGLDADYKAVEATSTYTPAQTFYLSVKVSNLEKGAVVKAEWFLRGKSIKEQEYTAEKSGSGYVGFSLEPDKSWPIGDYRADVYLGSEKVQQAKFSVVPPESAIPSKISRVTLAKGVDKDYNPIEPTVTFQTGDQVFAVINGDLGLYSQVRGEWILNGKVADKNVLTFTAHENATDTALFFRLDPPLPLGTQQVKIYLDGKLERALDFSVVEKAAGATATPEAVEAQPTTASKGGVEILSHRSYVDHAGNLWVVAEAQNKSGSNLSSLKLGAEIFDADGKSLGSASISPKTPVIGDGDKIPFGVFWSGDSLDIKKVDRYRVTVDDFQATTEAVPESPWSVVGDVQTSTTEEGNIVLSGKLQNVASEPQDRAEVWAAIYDADGNILGGGMATMGFDRAVAPGDQASFQITVAGPLPDADRYRLITVASSQKTSLLGLPPLSEGGIGGGVGGEGGTSTPTPVAILGEKGGGSGGPSGGPAQPGGNMPTPVGPAKTAGFATYTHSQWGFTLQYPASWAVDEESDQVTIAAADDSAGYVVASVDMQGQSFSAEQLLSLFVSGLKGEFSDFSVTSGVAPFTLDGAAGVQEKASFVVEGRQAESSIIATTHGGRGFFVMVLVEKGGAGLDGVVRQFQSGFRWTKQGASATPPPAGGAPKGQLLYTVWHGPGFKDYSLFLINASGGAPKKIVDLASEPSWSPDGKRFVYYHWTDGLYIANADGSGAHKIVADGEATYPDWSPKGDRIVYASPLGGGKFKIYLVIDTGGVTTGKDLGPGNRPAWSPDGKRIAYDNCDAQGHCGIWLMNEDGGNPHPLTSDGGGQAAWAPDGRRIAYASPADGDYEIVVINADGSGRRQLTKNTGNDALPTWSRDGRYIFYRTDQNGTGWAVYRMRADGSDKRKLVDAMVNPDRWQWERMDAR
jgi:TolB protein